MEHNFRIYYSKESQLPCVEFMDKETVVMLKAEVVECNVPTFGIYMYDNGIRRWYMAGKADSILQENNKIEIL